MSNVKCPQCGLVNFAGEEKCKRCEADLSDTNKLASQAVTAAPPNPNLIPCLDCGHMTSRNAESCPQCGRFIQRVVSPDYAKGAGSATLLAGVLALFGTIFGIAGLDAMYSPSQIVGGDAFNYIIAGTRGTGLICIGIGLIVLAAQLEIRSEIIRSRKY